MGHPRCVAVGTIGRDCHIILLHYFIMEVVLDDASIDGTASLNYYASPLNVGDFRSFFTQTSKFFVCFSDLIDKNYVQNNIKLIKGNSNFNKIFYSI